MYAVYIIILERVLYNYNSFNLLYKLIIECNNNCVLMYTKPYWITMNTVVLIMNYGPSSAVNQNSQGGSSLVLFMLKPLKYLY